MRCYLKDSGDSAIRDVRFPAKGFAAEREFDSLDEALTWANTTAACVGSLVLHTVRTQPMKWSASRTLGEGRRRPSVKRLSG
jgi:hypothetical protein